MRSCPAGHHNCHRRCQSQRAGAGYDQHRNAGVERVLNAAACDQPRRCGDHGDGHHRRDEDAAYPIGQLRDRRFAGGCFLHQRHNAGERRVLPDAGGADFQKAGHVDRGGHHRLSFVLGDRDALAGQCRLVDGRTAFEHHAVHGDAFARLEQDHVADDDFLRRHDAFLAVAQDGRRLGREVEQLGDRRAGLALRAFFQKLADRDQRQDHRR